MEILSAMNLLCYTVQICYNKFVFPWYVNIVIKEYLQVEHLLASEMMHSITFPPHFILLQAMIPNTRKLCPVHGC